MKALVLKGRYYIRVDAVGVRMNIECFVATVYRPVPK